MKRFINWLKNGMCFFGIALIVLNSLYCFIVNNITIINLILIFAGLFLCIFDKYKKNENNISSYSGKKFVTENDGELEIVEGQFYEMLQWVYECQNKPKGD